MRRLIIGDIHGCFLELQDLIAAAEITDEDEIISVGDMVDRGPMDREVVDFFRNTPNARAIKGNHELKHINWRAGKVRPSFSQRVCRHLFGDEAWNEAVDWFEQLPDFIDLPEALIVHGFFEPGVPIGEQRQKIVCGTLTGEKRMRPYGEPWYAAYDGDKPLVVGHLLYNGADPQIVEGRFYGLDTGCCHGERLTGLLLPGFQIVSVPARTDHWAAVRDANGHLRFAGLNPEEMKWEKLIAVLHQLEEQAETDRYARAKSGELFNYLEDAKGAQQTLLVEIEARHAAAEAALEVDRSDKRAYARAYSQAIGSTDLHTMLHLRRTQGFGEKQLRSHFKRPSDLLQFMRARRSLGDEADPPAKV
ncbi:MAG: metallophosphoesterase family protein [Myxococcota bacterium]